MGQVSLAAGARSDFQAIFVGELPGTRDNAQVATRAEEARHGRVKVDQIRSALSNIRGAPPGLFEGLKAGTITQDLGSFGNCSDTGVKLTAEDTVPCDVGILAVGWKLSVPFLGPQYQDKLIGQDEQFRVYRFAANPDLHDIGFVGFNSSFCIVLSAELVANWLMPQADGQVANMPDGAGMTANIDMMLDWKRNERPSAKGFGGLCSAPFQFKHFDELLADMRATKTRRANPEAETFKYPEARAYGEFLASAPQYEVG